MIGSSSSPSASTLHWLTAGCIAPSLAPALHRWSPTPSLCHHPNTELKVYLCCIPESSSSLPPAATSTSLHDGSLSWPPHVPLTASSTDKRTGHHATPLLPHHLFLHEYPCRRQLRWRCRHTMAPSTIAVGAPWTYLIDPAGLPHFFLTARGHAPPLLHGLLPA